MASFYSHGKVLLTSEYVVLAGAKALALPCTKGQSLHYEAQESKTLRWESYDWKNYLWFEVHFECSTLKIIQTSDPTVAKRLQQILQVARSENNLFLSQGGVVKTHLEFDRHWGLGSSSTLLVNIANWAEVNAFSLGEKTFGGSGYDIACGSAKGPIFYTRVNEFPKIIPVEFTPPFADELFFVYLNQKKNSQQAVQAFEVSKVTPSLITSLNTLTDAIATCKELKEFEAYLIQHEQLIGKLIGQKPIKEKLFNEYKGVIKSLGAWGGDFVLATGNEAAKSYFKEKGYTTVIPYREMCLDRI